MKLIFEEYGKVIISVIVAVIVLLVVFSGVGLISVIRNEADLKTEFHHQSDEEALSKVSQRSKPDISVINSDALKFSKGSEFNPKTSVKVTNADNTVVSYTSDGSTVAVYRAEGSGEVIKTVTWASDGTVSAVDSEGNTIAVVSEEDKRVPISLIINKIEWATYKVDSATGNYLLDDDGNRIQEVIDITDEMDTSDNTILIENTGTVYVTYIATDLYNVRCVETIAFAVDDLLNE